VTFLLVLASFLHAFKRLTLTPAMTSTLPPLTEVLDLMPDAVCVVDPEGRLLFVNASFQRIFGYEPEEVVGRQLFSLLYPDDLEMTTAQAERVMAGELQRHFRNRYVHKDGHTVDIQWSARWLPEHRVRIGVGHEVTELRRAERELEQRANHDELTGLVNRHSLQAALQAAIDRAADEGGCLAVLYIDLDGFKYVNDRGGHMVGDRLLRELAGRMQQAVRQKDLVARVGGDEFVVLLPDCRDLQAAREVADSLRARITAPCRLPEGLFQLDASIGVATFPADGADAEVLLAHADAMMYATKKKGTEEIKRKVR
jgi:diguanylate cyclase (GGDEF)-like protein/PAS domain S-box-containing protein